MKKKVHKTRRQLQAEQAAAAIQVVANANSLIDPLAVLPIFQKYTAKDGTVIELTCSRIKDVPVNTVNWIFDLMKSNMQLMYEHSSWGWHEEAKKEELTEESAWYLIASSEGKHIGFSHFRFDLDNGIQVLYCYELQLEPSARRKGLGRFMMKALETIAANNEMQKVILTVFKHNTMAVLFYRVLGYKVDLTSPPASDKLDYAILSKQNLQRLTCRPTRDDTIKARLEFGSMK